jgi:hypothetical protein
MATTLGIPDATVLSFGILTLIIRWRGNSGGWTKEALCGEIVGIMAGAGITHRQNNDVRAKISEIITDYNKARDWLGNTGSGIEGDGTEQSIRGRCTHPSAFVAL